jgi:hypothetical protein
VRVGDVSSSNVLSEASGDAPLDSGVYFFLGSDRELLYVGKATSLRQRLRQHARAARRTGETRLAILYQRVAEVRWEPMSDEQSAAAREADFIVALRPRFNASHVDQGRWNYILLAPVERVPTLTRFTLSNQIPPSRRPAYGCFPHLGRGVSSSVGRACSDGYTALLRLLWVASSAGAVRFPSAVGTGRVPDTFDVEVREAWRSPLHALLSGASARVLRDLSQLQTPEAPHLAPGLARDAAAAMMFFRHGPAALRQLRLRHGQRSSPVTRDRVTELLAADLAKAIGDVRPPKPPDPTAQHLGRRAHPWAT